MKRKLVRQAGQAITITLPIEWIRENNLKPGEEVDIEIIEKNILIKTNKKSVGKNIDADLRNMGPQNTKVYINAAYAVGIDEIKLKSNLDLYKHMNQNIGYAIVNHKSEDYTIKDIGGMGNNNMDEIFKQVFQMLIAFYEKAINEMFGKNKIDHEQLRQLDNEINKYALFLERSTIKHAYNNSVKGKIMFAYAYSLEQIGDEILRTWRTTLYQKIKKDKNVLKIFELSQDALIKTFEMHYNFNNDKFQQLINLKEDIRKKTLQLKIDNATAQFISHATRIVEECADLTQLIIMLRIYQ